MRPAFERAGRKYEQVGRVDFALRKLRNRLCGYGFDLYVDAGVPGLKGFETTVQPCGERAAARLPIRM